MHPHRMSTLLLHLTLISAACPLAPAQAAGDHGPFAGQKSSWHDGFDRYDYLMDETTFDIQPFRRGDDERFGIKDLPRENAGASSSSPGRPPRATHGRGAAATGTISRRPRWSCSVAASTSPTSRPARP